LAIGLRIFRIQNQADYQSAAGYNLPHTISTNCCEAVLCGPCGMKSCPAINSNREGLFYPDRGGFLG